MYKNINQKTVNIHQLNDEQKVIYLVSTVERSKHFPR